MGANQLCSQTDLPLISFPFLPEGLEIAQKNPTLTDQQLEFLSHICTFICIKRSFHTSK